MKSKALGLLVVGLLALPSVAQAALVTISGQGSADGVWDVTTVTGTFLPPDISGQPWWGSDTTARAFSDALGGQLGYPNAADWAPTITYAPFFGYATGVTAIGPLAISRTTKVDGTSFIFQDRDRNNVYTWAVAARAITPPPPVPLPAAAWLLLSGLGGLGFLGRRRKAA